MVQPWPAVLMAVGLLLLQSECARAQTPSPTPAPTVCDCTDNETALAISLTDPRLAPLLSLWPSSLPRNCGTMSGLCTTTSALARTLSATGVSPDDLVAIISGFRCTCGETCQQTCAPTSVPTAAPTYGPTRTPTRTPTYAPTRTPSRTPILQTNSPTMTIGSTLAPTTAGPTAAPTAAPTRAPTTVSPAPGGTAAPTTTLAPTSPTLAPSAHAPSYTPTHSPTPTQAVTNQGAANGGVDTTVLVGAIVGVLVLLIILGLIYRKRAEHRPEDRAPTKMVTQNVNPAFAAHATESDARRVKKTVAPVFVAETILSGGPDSRRKTLMEPPSPPPRFEGQVKVGQHETLRRPRRVKDIEYVEPVQSVGQPVEYAAVDYDDVTVGGHRDAPLYVAPVVGGTAAEDEADGLYEEPVSSGTEPSYDTNPLPGQPPSSGAGSNDTHYRKFRNPTASVTPTAKGTRPRNDSANDVASPHPYEYVEAPLPADTEYAAVPPPAVPAGPQRSRGGEEGRQGTFYSSSAGSPTVTGAGASPASSHNPTLQRNPDYDKGNVFKF